MAGLVREAAIEALEDAGMTWSDIDAVVIGKAPDMFEGVAMPELYLADALGAVGKPMMRVHTAGSVGGSTSIVAAKLVAAGIHERVLTVAYEKQSESNATWGLSVPMPFAAPLVAGAGGYFAPLIRAYMYRSGAPRHIGHLVAVKDRLAALRNPKAHLHLPDIDLKTVEESFLLWDPLRYLDVCPSSDGAMAMVMGSEKVADASEGPVAWIHGMAMRSEPTMFARRDQINPQAGKDCAKDVYAQAGITNPREDFDCAEVYVPFSWYEPMWLENLGFCAEGDGWKLTEAGATAPDGDIPWNPSGGVLSSNPIGASGMVRFGEAAQQVRGRAGDYQVELKTGKALGHAYGGGSQFFSMWVVGSEKPAEQAKRALTCGNELSTFASRFPPIPAKPAQARVSPGFSMTQTSGFTRPPAQRPQDRSADRSPRRPGAAPCAPVGLWLPTRRSRRSAPSRSRRHRALHRARLTDARRGAPDSAARREPRPRLGVTDPRAARHPIVVRVRARHRRATSRARGYARSPNDAIAVCGKPSPSLVFVVVHFIERCARPAWSVKFVEVETGPEDGCGR